LVLLIKRSSNRLLLSAVYHNPTHSDRYLNSRSEHPIQHKQSVVNTLFERAKKLFSTAQDLQQRNEICETDFHVELLPQMDDSKQKEETTQQIFLVYI